MGRLEAQGGSLAERLPSEMGRLEAQAFRLPNVCQARWDGSKRRRFARRALPSKMGRLEAQGGSLAERLPSEMGRLEAQGVSLAERLPSEMGRLAIKSRVRETAPIRKKRR
ncbi:MAG: hypothetical protein J6K20_04150 [Thermoguttaceae bacterium]|nr:hypothetical protein [Thermoguttaceae bacterium]